MTHTFSPRVVFAAIVLLCAVSMAFAYFFLQQYLGLAPCPLCMSQRVFIVACGVFALIGFLHNPGGVGIRVYGALCTLSAVLGGAVAGRHIWLQHLPPDQVPACGPSLEYILETLPFGQALELILMGDGNCAEKAWTFAGLSIPEQTLLVFIVAASLSLWQTLRSYPRSA